MRKLKYFFRRFRTGLQAIGLFKNWPKAFSIYFRRRTGLEVLVLRDGTRFKVRRQAREMQRVVEVYAARPYHRYLSSLEAGATIIDIGANIGSFSVLAASRCPGAAVYSYEPFPESYQLLEDNVALNGLTGQIHAFNLGVAGAKGQRDLFIDDSQSGGHGMFSDRADSQRITINVVSLADVFTDNALNSCDLLKMDCEGAEFEILYGAPEALLQSIRMMVFEIHASRAANKVAEVKTFLEDQGFVVDTGGVVAGYGLVYAER